MKVARSDERVRPLAADSLAYALLGAARVCEGVRSGRTLRDGLAQERVRFVAMKSKPVRSDPIGAIHDLSARALRRRGRADALLAHLGGRVPDPPLLRELLVVAMALVVDALDATWPDDATFETRVAALPYSPFTVVDQAVHAATAVPEMARAKGFVNAILRTLLRGIESDRAALAKILDGPRASDESRHALPSWWMHRLRRAYPDDWPAVVASARELPPLVLRVNRAQGSVDDYLATLADHGIPATRVGPVAVRIDTPMPVARLPGFEDGRVSVQDAAAQLAAPLLVSSPDAGTRMRVLDACAAPGGKTGHLLEIHPDIECVAVDSDADRLARVRENLDRLRLSATLVRGDAATPQAWWDGRPFDRILADVPCTASGILRRHPDIRWLRREADIRRLSLHAQHIADALWPLLNPGGRFLFVTCSVFPEESAIQADAFAARHPDALVLPSPGQLLPGRLDPSIATTDHDGLFFALYEKMR